MLANSFVPQVYVLILFAEHFNSLTTIHELHWWQKVPLILQSFFQINTDTWGLVINK